jgi:hypothetical protein
MPKFRGQPAPTAPCTNGCSAQYPAAPVDTYPNSPDWTSPNDSGAAIETIPYDNYSSPVYTGKPVITGETVISPEIAPMPTAP